MSTTTAEPTNGSTPEQPGRKPRAKRSDAGVPRPKAQTSTQQLKDIKALLDICARDFPSLETVLRTADLISLDVLGEKISAKVREERSNRITALGGIIKD